MAFISGKMQSCPIIQTTMIDISNKILKLGRVQKFFYFFKISILRSPQKILIVALLIFPPVTPSIRLGCCSVYSLALLWWCRRSIHVSSYTSLLRCDSLKVHIISKIIDSTCILVNQKILPFLLIEFSHIKILEEILPIIIAKHINYVLVVDELREFNPISIFLDLCHPSPSRG